MRAYDVCVCVSEIGGGRCGVGRIGRSLGLPLFKVPVVRCVLFKSARADGPHSLPSQAPPNKPTIEQPNSSGAAAGGGGRSLPTPSSPSRPLCPRYGAVDPVGLSSLEEGQQKQKQAAAATATPPFLSRAESKEESLSQPLSLQFAWLALKQVLMGRTLNLLLLTLPFGALSALLGWGAGPTFILNFLGLIPLAAILGDFTEVRVLMCMF